MGRQVLEVILSVFVLAALGLIVLAWIGVVFVALGYDPNLIR